MSKKTVVFKMPPKDAPRPEDELGRNFSAGEEQASPLSQFAEPETEYESSSEPDQWVQRRDARTVAQAPAMVAAPSSAPTALRSVTIDLAAERDLREVAALTLLVPPMLGWFWLFNVMNRVWNRFG
jgi:hypothetical protein